MKTGLDAHGILSRSLVKMLKLFLSREVAMQCAALKSKKKNIFYITNFCGSVLGNNAHFLSYFDFLGKYH